ncbi:MAG TPA: hypothetical protein VLT32_19505 [Candidatus Sulfomarinibacteraceae bacterium]|nr:hypothetical protein [Candidatus Sulfomarinibacteraceae bacterium]
MTMPRRMLSIGTFVGVAILSVVAAATRFDDSAHALGLISQQGGRVRHPVHVAEGKSRYTFIVTATVLPPYRGDVEVAVEGPSHPRFEVHANEPAVDLGLARRPRFADGVIVGLEPGDRVALWFVLSPDPDRRGPDAGRLRGRHEIVFRDVATGTPVLTVPVVFGEGGGEHHGH